MDLELARELYKQLIDGTHTAEEVKSDILYKIAEKLGSKRGCMQNQRAAVLCTISKRNTQKCTPVSRMACTLYEGVIVTGLVYPLIWQSNRSSCVVSKRAVD